MPYLNLTEIAFLMRVTPQTIRKWNKSTDAQCVLTIQHFLSLLIGGLTLRTCNILNYQDGSTCTATLPSTLTNVY
jgi:hypothetical protein